MKGYLEIRIKDIQSITIGDKYMVMLESKLNFEVVKKFGHNVSKPFFTGYYEATSTILDESIKSAIEYFLSNDLNHRIMNHHVHNEQWNYETDWNDIRLSVVGMPPEFQKLFYEVLNAHNKPQQLIDS